MPDRTPKSRKPRKPSQRGFIKAIISGDLERVRQMQKAGASPSAPDQYGWLPIHRAAANDRDKIIRLLVKWGSPLEARGTEGWTPLHLAAVSRSSRAVTALLAAGANVNARSDFGTTPLHLAIGATINEPMLETARILVRAGAATGACDDKGKTPFDKARELVGQTTQLLTILKNASSA